MSWSSSITKTCLLLVTSITFKNRNPQTHYPQDVNGILFQLIAAPVINDKISKALGITFLNVRRISQKTCLQRFTLFFKNLILPLI
jgi:hypothetical protein